MIKIEVKETSFSYLSVSSTEGSSEVAAETADKIQAAGIACIAKLLDIKKHKVKARSTVVGKSLAVGFKIKDNRIIQMIECAEELAVELRKSGQKVDLTVVRDFMENEYAQLHPTPQSNPKLRDRKPRKTARIYGIKKR